MGGQADTCYIITKVFLLRFLIAISSTAMAQGNMKKKTSLPGGVKKKQKHDKTGVMKKGKRFIAPAKTRVVEESKTKKSLTLAINKKIESELLSQANNSELKQLNVLKKDGSTQSSKPSSSSASKS